MSDSRRRDAEHPEGEAEEIVRGLAHDLEDVFLGYLRGEIPFDELTFRTFDTLQAVHAVGTGSYTVEYVDEESDTAEQEELAQEPVREAPDRKRKR